MNSMSTSPPRANFRFQGALPGNWAKSLARMSAASAKIFVRFGALVSVSRMTSDTFAARLAGPAITQCVGLRSDFAKHPVCGECIHHIAQHRVVDAVAYEANNIVSKQFADKACGPSFGKIGEAKVTT